MSSLPAGVVSRKPGEAAVRQAAAAGLILDPWQQLVLREALGIRQDGKWAAFEVGLIVPRQNGKGSILEALALAALFQFDTELTVWTAHQMKTAKEGFRRLVGHISSTPDLSRQVAAIKRGNDDRGIELKDGRRIQFIARGTGGSGRGFTADLLIFDEAYELSADTIADTIPTLSAVPNPQVWYTSSAPMETSEQLHAVRKRGLSGNDKRLAFFEWSVPRDADYQSPDAIVTANPAYGIRIDDEFINAERSAMNANVDPSKWARERLGVPDMPPEDGSVIALDVWRALEDDESRIESGRSWAVAVSPLIGSDPQWGCIGIAGRRADGHLHVEFMAGCHKPGTSWLVPAIVSAWESKRIPVRIHKSGPESFLIPKLRELGVEVVEVTTAEVSQATGELIDAANAWLADHDGRQLVHHPQQIDLERAVAGAVLRVGGEGAAVWSQRNSQVEITPLMAVTVALTGVSQNGPSWLFV